MIVKVEKRLLHVFHNYVDVKNLTYKLQIYQYEIIQFIHI